MISYDEKICFSIFSAGFVNIPFISRRKFYFIKNLNIFFDCFVYNYMQS